MLGRSESTSVAHPSGTIFRKDFGFVDASSEFC